MFSKSVLSLPEMMRPKSRQRRCKW